LGWSEEAADLLLLVEDELAVWYVANIWALERAMKCTASSSSGKRIHEAQDLHETSKRRYLPTPGP
jgi:hypothetical protein